MSSSLVRWRFKFHNVANSYLMLYSWVLRPKYFVTYHTIHAVLYSTKTFSEINTFVWFDVT